MQARDVRSYLMAVENFHGAWQPGTNRCLLHAYLGHGDLRGFGFVEGIFDGTAIFSMKLLGL